MFRAGSFILYRNMQVKNSEAFSCLGKHDFYNHIIGINNYLNGLTLYFFCIFFDYLQVAFSASVMKFKFGKWPQRRKHKHVSTKLILLFNYMGTKNDLWWRTTRFFFHSYTCIFMGNKSLSPGFISNKKLGLCVRQCRSGTQLTLPLVLEDSNVISQKACLFWKRHLLILNLVPI